MRLLRAAASALRAAPSRPITAVLAATAIISGFFLAFPGIDLWFSGLFYAPDTGFWAASDPFLIKLRALGPFIVWMIAISSLAILAIRIASPDRAPLTPLRAPLFMLTTLALGPGLLVNGILKSYSGRPRPRYVEAFGGDLPYVPVWRFTDYCASNCSFVSGEGSSGMWYLALALVVPLSWRLPVALGAGLIGFAVSLNRVAFGGHFLSDSLLAWCLTALVILLTHRLFYRNTPAFLRDDALDRGLARFGLWLRETLADAKWWIGETIRNYRA